MGNSAGQFAAEDGSEGDFFGPSVCSSVCCAHFPSGTQAPTLVEDEIEFCPDHEKKAHIIFDWDDTLMCSSVIKAQMDPDPEEVTALAEAVEEVLRKAIKLGRTAIVTNANLKWVATTARIFMPSVVPLLSLVELVSARQAYGHKCPGDHSAWKRHAFRDLLGGKSFSRPKSDDGVNLVVVGDSSEEIQAGRSVIQGRSSDTAIVKTVKLKQAPSIGELCGQLKALAQSLPHIVGEDRSSSKLLVRGTGCASCGGWSVCDASCSAAFWNMASAPWL